MTPDQAAAKLDRNQYREEGSPELFAEMKASGLVALFGYSDDLAELRGAIEDETGGSTIYLDRNGLIQNECDDDRCPYFLRLRALAKTIEPEWDNRGYSWTYKTQIPHATFVILEDDETYCEGIVFRLDDC